MSHDSAHDEARREPGGAAADGAPTGPVQQMEELMAALNADLSQLDAELQSSADRAPGTPSPASSRTSEGDRSSSRPS
ncbi:hypothetical protein HYE82_25140 [Streptomyces sp. BR123]|uniref:hypothetical protein n=1 Tax=Streptomyces sp. BR123 TaxID=2749828 RepID=UPI0015C4E2B7|nr:hypothetical protein [Streptomyces sp. BR123]NXY97600.1 hypothetical protein [Streptomyces sp. BR123]